MDFACNSERREQSIKTAGIPGEAAGFVDGAWTFGGGARLIVEDPACEDQLAVVTESDPAAVGAAVASASAAFEGSWAMGGATRGRVLQAIAAAIRSEAGLLAELETLDTGKPLSQAAGDVEVAARYFEFYAGMTDKLHGETIPLDGAAWAYTLLEPFGVVAHITPWNSPLSQLARGVAPCLAAGNTTVVKPSEITPLSSLYVAKLMVEAGLPAGACNVVVGAGPTTGANLVRESGVARVTFTGSVPTGREILRLAADRIIGCNLELGGKSGSIVLPDADLALAARAGAGAVIRNAGQSCVATTRMLVHADVYDEFVELLVATVEGLTVGHGLDDPDLGPLVSAKQRAAVLASIAGAVEAGAVLRTGGVAPDVPTGHFVLPTVLAEVDNSMEVAQHEVFGPVQTVIRVHDVDEAVALTNDTVYGLGAGVFTRDIGAAHRIAKRLQAGQVHVNGYPLGGIETPFGGYKQSGLGREKGLEALRHYTQVKTVIVSDD